MKADKQTMDNKIFWERVNVLLGLRKKTREKLASETGIPINTLLGWMSKKRLPDAEQVCKIASSLNTTVEYLVTGNEPSVKDRSLELIEEIVKIIDSYR